MAQLLLTAPPPPGLSMVAFQKPVLLVSPPIAPRTFRAWGHALSQGFGWVMVGLFWGSRGGAGVSSGRARKEADTQERSLTTIQAAYTLAGVPLRPWGGMSIGLPGRDAGQAAVTKPRRAVTPDPHSRESRQKFRAVRHTHNGKA